MDVNAIHFSNAELTLADMLNVQRLYHGGQINIDAMTSLLEARTDLTRQQILAIGFSDFEAVLLRLADAISEAVAVTRLDLNSR